MFLHASILHIGFNMYALWVIGTPVEQYLGKARYLGLYFVSGLAGSAGRAAAVAVRPRPGSVRRDLRDPRRDDDSRVAGHGPPRGTGGGTLVAINLGLSFVIPNISWGGHVGGLIGGILIMLAYGHWGGTAGVPSTGSSASAACSG